MYAYVPGDLGDVVVWSQESFHILVGDCGLSLSFLTYQMEE
jgi:hypothetical protein